MGDQMIDGMRHDAWLTRARGEWVETIGMIAR